MTGIPTDSRPIEEEVKTADEQAEETEKSETDPAESSPEKKSEEAAPSDADENTDVNIPLNKDKRFKEIIKDRDEARAQLSELMEWKRQSESALKTQAQTQDIPQWFREIYGDDPNVWKVMQAQFSEIRKQAADEAYQRLESQKQAEVKQLEEAKKFVDSQFEALKEEGKTFDKNAVIDTALKLKLFDDNGNYNLRAAYEVWSAKQSRPQNTVKKRIASESVRGSKGDAKQEGHTLSELRKLGGFRGFNKYLENNV